MKKSMPLNIVLILALAMLPGCASKYGEQRTAVEYFPQCYQPIKDLRDREYDVAKGAAGGAVIGAIGGALIGVLATGKAEGALIGAAGGAAAGGIAGGVYASKQKELDDTRRLASYLQSLDGDISKLDIDSAAARTSLQCYDRQFEALLREIKAKAVTREAATRRFAEIQSGREEAILILGQLENYGRDLNQQYEQAFMQEARDMTAPQKQNVAANVRRQNQRTLVAANAKRANLEKTAARIGREKAEAQQASVKQTAAINEAIGELDVYKA